MWLFVVAICPPVICSLADQHQAGNKCTDGGWCGRPAHSLCRIIHGNGRQADIPSPEWVMGGQVPSSTGCCHSIRPARHARLASRARYAICLHLNWNLSGAGCGPGTETGTGTCSVCFVWRVDDGIKSELAQSPTNRYIRTCAGLDGGRWGQIQSMGEMGMDWMGWPAKRERPTCAGDCLAERGRVVTQPSSSPP